MAAYIKHNSFWIFVLILVSYLFIAGVCVESSQGNNPPSIMNNERIAQYVNVSNNARIIAFETMPQVCEIKKNFLEFNTLKEEYLNLIKEADSLRINR